MQVPFERIGMDLIGPLERSAQGTSVCLSSSGLCNPIPEAVALRNISAKSVAEALFRMISRVGIQKEVLNDQGTAFMSWELSLFAPASTTHKRTAWWNDLIAHWKQWFESSFTKTPKIGTDGWNPFCSLCERSCNPPLSFPPSSSFMGASPEGFWTSWERHGRRDLRRARMKFSKYWTWEQHSTPWGSSPWRICYRPRTSKAGCTIGEPDYAILPREIKYLYYSRLLALNYSRSGKGLSRSHDG